MPPPASPLRRRGGGGGGGSGPGGSTLTLGSPTRVARGGTATVAPAAPPAPSPPPPPASYAYSPLAHVFQGAAVNESLHVYGVVVSASEPRPSRGTGE